MMGERDPQKQLWNYQVNLDKRCAAIIRYGELTRRWNWISCGLLPSIPATTPMSQTFEQQPVKTRPLRLRTLNLSGFVNGAAREGRSKSPCQGTDRR